MTPFCWALQHVSQISAAAPSTALITRAMLGRVVAGLDVWDHWPVLEDDGSIATIAGGELVIALSAPSIGSPDDRHTLARLRLFHRVAGVWHDLGHLLPDGFSPGSREWAGSAVVDPAHRQLTLHFTAAGRRDEAVLSFGQRLFATTAAIETGSPRLSGWSHPAETVAPDGSHYETRLGGGKTLGTTKAFRDPFVWRDPQDDAEYLLFAASRAGTDSPWNGVVGLAQRRDGGWRLLPPIVDATGLNNELERPHLVVIDRRRYLFWSTQASVFADGGPRGPNGLYGIVSDDIAGPWRPLNGSCLVLRNPDSAPFQAYSWQVFPDGSVWSFADMVGLAAPPRDAAEARRHFGGVPAPCVTLVFDGDRVVIR